MALRKSVVFFMNKIEDFLFRFFSEEKSASEYESLLFNINSILQDSKNIEDRIHNLSTEIYLNHDFCKKNPFFSKEEANGDEALVINICNNLLKSGQISDLIHSKEIIFGSSFVLKYLVNFLEHNPETKLSDTCLNISERILRQMEVKKEEILSFRDAPKDRIQLLSEQIRMIIVLLCLYRHFEDLRFLNASIKAHDRIFKSITKISRSNLFRNIKDEEIVVLAYFHKSFNLQEVLMSRLEL